jgi:hypothetical protein
VLSLFSCSACGTGLLSASIETCNAADHCTKSLTPSFLASSFKNASSLTFQASATGMHCLVILLILMVSERPLKFIGYCFDIYINISTSYHCFDQHQIMLNLLYCRDVHCHRLCRRLDHHDAEHHGITA